MSLNKELGKFQNIVSDFAKERDWEQFHTIKNLAMALSVEVSELGEIFQWARDEKEIESLLNKKKVAVEDEMIDIFIYWLRIATKMDLDIEKSFERKFKANVEKYPADKVRGNSKKYSEY